MAAIERTGPAFRHPGRCHCGAVRFGFETQSALDAFTPRACDCDFCTRHGAAWVSDAEGKLAITGAGAVRRYRQGSNQAEFLFCGQCGVLVAVICTVEDGASRGAVNRNSFDERHLFGEEAIASPQQLAPDAKRSRWSQLWTPTTLA